MKKPCKQDYIIKVGNPPPKQSSVLTAKGGHKPAKDDRVKFSYTDEPPADTKRKPKKLKAIIFGESNYEENLDEGLGDLLTAFVRGLGFKGGVYGKFADFVDPKLGQENTIKIERILRTPLTIAEKYLINKDLMDEKEIREYRKLVTIYKVYGSKAQGPEEISAELRPGAYEQLKDIESRLYDIGGLEDKYESAIAYAEEALGLPPGSGRFDSGVGSYGRYGGYTRYGSRRYPTGYTRPEKSISRREKDTKEEEEEEEYKLSPEEKEAATKQKLLIVLESYIGSNGMLHQADTFLDKLIPYINSTYPAKTKLQSDLTRRQSSIRAYIKELNKIQKQAGAMKASDLKGKLNAYLGRVRPAMSRMRDLQDTTRETYGDEPGFPKEILSIPFVWTNPKTGAELTGEEKVD
jgi:hypothetical protein